MKHVGYGVTRNNKPTGIWPLPLQQALERRAGMSADRGRDKLEVVPIYIGEPVTNVAIAPRKEKPA